jgi:hypothetical protein
MPYDSDTGLYERRTTTVIDASPDGDTVYIAIDAKLDLAADDTVTDLNHHATNGNHYPATSTADDSRFLRQSPSGTVSWANGVVAADAALKDFSNVVGGAIAPAKVAQDASNRFFTDAERTKLEGIQALAQVNADITKAEIEAKLTGSISTHTHADASTTAKGLIEIATDAEVQAGTSTSLAVTPAGLTAAKLLSFENCMHVVDEKTSGTAGGSSSATTWHTRDLNTVRTNTIDGASLSANRITLPAGSYIIYGRAPSYNSNATRAQVYNVTDANTLLMGRSRYNGTTASVTLDADIFASFTLGAQKTLELRHYTQSAKSGDGLGQTTSLGAEIYSEVIIWKI